MQALILAGGQGTRLRPLTDLYPKPLLYLPGGRLIDYLLAQLRKTGIHDIGIVVHYGADQVLDYIAAEYGPDAVTPIFQEPPYTLVGALASAVGWVHSPTLVLHGDNYFSFSLRYLVQLAVPEVATFLVDELPNWDGQPSSVAAGAYVLPPYAFRVAGEVAEADDLAHLVAELRRRAFPTFSLPAPGEWKRYNINQPADLLEANRYLLSRWPSVEHPPGWANWGYDPSTFSWVAPDALVEGSDIGFHVTVGRGATVRWCRFQNSLVFPGVELEGVEGENLILVDTPDELITVYVSDVPVAGMRG